MTDPRPIARVHWLGAGLSSTPGIRRLARQGVNLTVWDIDIERARKSVHGFPRGRRSPRVRSPHVASLERELVAGDVVVSMLPADQHAEVARRSVDAGAHFICSSYLTDALRRLDGAARQKGLVVIGEVGLDPGIDHLLAHELVARARAAGCLERGARVSLQSWCGGLPAVPNRFRYRFSWSPLAVLKALRSPAAWIENGRAVQADRPWEALRTVQIRWPFEGAETETFEAYPNRDSRPYVIHYGLGDGIVVDDFVRGTLRLDGWAGAWQGVFERLEALDRARADDVESQLQALSDALIEQHGLAHSAADRVVMSVELTVRDRDGRQRWQEARRIDAYGDERASAMSRLVSETVCVAVQSTLRGQFDPGVQAAPSDPARVADWLDTLTRVGVPIQADASVRRGRLQNL